MLTNPFGWPGVLRPGDSGQKRFLYNRWIKFRLIEKTGPLYLGFEKMKLA
jgi:hypothetical protein